MKILPFHSVADLRRGFAVERRSRRTPPEPKTPPTILAATVPTAAVPPGKPVRITYHWEAVPMGKDFQIFVHGKDAKSALVFQDDHQPPYPLTTANWQGKRELRARGQRAQRIVPDGTYRLEAGVYDPKTGRVPLRAGQQRARRTPT